MSFFRPFSFTNVDTSWQACLAHALELMPDDYLQTLYASDEWLPGADKIFNAFSLPVQQVNYVLFGESPYPRKKSANGYAFWDAAVEGLWSQTGLSKAVNRATSLRNFIKMLLVAEGALSPFKTGQTNIAELNKNQFVQSNQQLFNNILAHGFLLLNATPVLRPGQVRQDARVWRPFIQYVLNFLYQARANDLSFILFGNIANTIDALLPNHALNKLYAEHPYNISFIQNSEVAQFFKPLHLLHLA